MHASEVDGGRVGHPGWRIARCAWVEGVSQVQTEAGELFQALVVGPDVQGWMEASARYPWAKQKVYWRVYV